MYGLYWIVYTTIFNGICPISCIALFRYDGFGIFAQTRFRIVIFIFCTARSFPISKEIVLWWFCCIFRRFFLCAPVTTLNSDPTGCLRTRLDKTGPLFFPLVISLSQAFRNHSQIFVQSNASISSHVKHQCLFYGMINLVFICGYRAVICHHIESILLTRCFSHHWDFHAIRTCNKNIVLNPVFLPERFRVLRSFQFFIKYVFWTNNANVVFFTAADLQADCWAFAAQCLLVQGISRLSLSSVLLCNGVHIFCFFGN